MYIIILANNNNIVSQKMAHLDCLPIPQFCLDFLLRSKTYLKEHPPSASIANRELIKHA